MASYWSMLLASGFPLVDPPTLTTLTWLSLSTSFATLLANKTQIYQWRTNQDGLSWPRVGVQSVFRLPQWAAFQQLVDIDLPEFSTQPHKNIYCIFRNKTEHESNVFLDTKRFLINAKKRPKRRNCAVKRRNVPTWELECAHVGLEEVLNVTCRVSVSAS